MRKYKLYYAHNKHLKMLIFARFQLQSLSVKSLSTRNFSSVLIHCLTCFFKETEALYISMSSMTSIPKLVQ